MPADDVSDLKDVFDAINRLCETMKTSNYSDDESLQFVECSDGSASPADVTVRLEYRAELIDEDASAGDVAAEEAKESPERASQFVSAEDLSIQRMEAQRQKWKESQASLASSEISVPREGRWEERSPPADSELYYTASSEASDVTDKESVPVADATDRECVLVSDATDKERVLVSDAIDRECVLVSDAIDRECVLVSDAIDRECVLVSDAADKECVLAGHVAAMRERFESMTRANTPRPASPEHERDVTPSPDLLR